MAVTIAAVQKGSAAARLGLAAGDVLHAIDGAPINDMLDYGFYTARSRFTLQATVAGEMRTLTVQKPEDAPFGCDFETYLIDKQHSCSNGCIFCFVDQMPPGMRPSLYFKDDDERLSFLYGNYITLTNLSQAEADRITAMHISPINISVHTTDPVLRIRMMHNRHAGDVLRYIDQFAAAGIKMNFQIVLCPGYNDGIDLTETLERLTAYYPAAASVAVVPVGLTRYREGLVPLTPVDAAAAADAIRRVQLVGEDCIAAYGTRIAYASDELFLLAGQDIPDADYYEDYPQLENGVGMMRLLEEEFDAALQTAPVRRWPRSVDIATGEAAYPLLCRLADRCMQKNPAVKIKVHCIKNNFFGGTVTVAGLITGADLLAQLPGQLAAKRLLLPRVMLRAERDRFLDDVTTDELAKKLGVRISIVGPEGDALLAAFLGRRAPRPLR